MARPDPAEARRGIAGAQIALIVVLVLVLLFVVWFFLLRGGGEEPVEEAAPTPTETETPEPTPTAKPPPKKPGRGPVETFEVFAPKDPFEPLVSEAAAGGEAGGDQTAQPAGAGEQPAGGDGQNGDGQNGGGGGGGQPGAARGPSGGGGQSVGGHTVRLVDVFTAKGRPRAQVQVDGTVYTVDEDETFAQNFKLLSASGECASMLFGDDQFTLCEGEEILK